jgi:glycosyltransferase involved in cell wall biosynthesis
VAVVRTLDPESPGVRAAAPLRVAWFGHASGRRADGLSGYSHAIVSALHERGVETQFYSHVDDGELAPSQHHVQLSSLRFKTVTMSRPGSLRRIDEELERFGPDVVHVSISFSLLEGTLAALAHHRGIPVVATVHLPYAASGSSRGRVMRGLYRFHARRLATYDRCIALSDEQRDLLVATGVPDERITVIHNGIDVDALVPAESPPDRDGVLVLYLGRLDPEKRVAALVRAFVGLGLPSDHRLVVAGSGTQEQRIRRLAAGVDNVSVLGMVSQETAEDLLRRADIFVLPSTAEGLSMSLLQAMAAGCAVIATDVGEDGAALGDAGILLPVHPLEPALSGALQRLVGDPVLTRTLGRRARARVESGYSLRANVDRVLGVYSELVRRSVAA